MNQRTRNSVSRGLIYVFPALIDILVVQIGFVNAIRLAKMGASASVVGGVAAVWGFIYMVTCLVVSRIASPANATRMMIWSCATLTVLCWLFTVVDGIVWMYILCASVGATTAFFFPPFQIFMKAVDSAGSRPITSSAGLYTFSWSMGFAIGPFVAGFLMETGTATSTGLETSGWKWVYAVSGAAAIATVIGLRMLAHLTHTARTNERVASGHQASSPPFDYSQMPDLAWLAWIVCGTGVVVFTIVRAVFPVRAVSELHLSDSTQGTILFLMGLTQALTAAALCLSRLWMYRPAAVGAFGIVGIIATLLYGFGTSQNVLCCAGALFGVYSGALFVYLVVHALAHPVKSSHYVAINESIVGLMGIIGSVFGGLLADHFGFSFACTAGAMAILMATLFQVATHRRNPPVPANSRRHQKGNAHE
ncbi:MAG: MFS transporter [bacterium]